MENKEFYIGWQSKAPAGFANHIRNVLLVLLAIVLVTGWVLGFFQKKFSTGNFEFGKLTEVTGIYHDAPVPALLVEGQNDLFGNRPLVTIPLLGFGKFGAERIIKAYEQKKNLALDGKQVRLKGTLLYNDGKLLMQIDSNDHPFMDISPVNVQAQHTVTKDLGEMTLKGEIVDSKCYFGVMKPGQGKPHKDCAIRCILGGIPPVFRTQNEKGEIHYFLLHHNGSETINRLVKNYVAQPVTIRARATRLNDWIILDIGSEKDIAGISRRSIFIPEENTQYCAAH